jgi:competence protein ComEC
MTFTVDIKRIRKTLVIAIAAIAVLTAYFFAFRAVFVVPAERYADFDGELTFVASGYSVKRISERGLRYTAVTAKLKRSGLDVGARVIIFNDTTELVPGQEFTLVPTSVETITPSGGLVLSVAARSVSLGADGNQGSVKYLPKRIAHRLSEVADEIFAPDTAAFLKSLIIGDREDWYADDALPNAFSRAGISHIVAISGMHLGFLCGFIGIIFGTNRLRSVVGIPAVLLFMLVTGGSPSVVRAGIMSITMYIAALVNRDYSGPRALVVALVIQYFINPYILFSKSAILSYSAVAGIFLFQRKLFLKTKHKFLKPIFELISVSLAANVFTFPLSAILFGRVSLVFVLTNLLVLWAVAPAFIIGIAALGIGAAMPVLGKIIGFIPVILTRYMLIIANAVSGIPFAAVGTDSVYVSVWVVYVTIASIVLIAAKEVRRRALIFSVAVTVTLVIAVGLPVYRRSAMEMSAAALDVGQGQCLVFESEGAAFVIDCGGDASGSEGDIAADYLESIGIRKLDALILTHFHADHAGGAERLLERVHIDTLIVPALDEEERGELGGSVLAAAERRGTVIKFVEREELMQTVVGTAELTVYPPLGSKGVNERGLIIYIRAGDKFSALVTGDADSETELKFTEYGDTPDIDVLFAGHHGSKYSSSEIFLEAVKPEVAVISVGEGNSYGHPADDTLARFALGGTDIYRTDLNGTIEIVLVGSQYRQ